MNLKSITFPGLEEEYSIQLTAEDVGARPDTWMPTLAELGAAPGGYGYGEGLVNIGNANDDATFTAALTEQFKTIGNKTKQIMFSYGGNTFVGTLWNAGNNYGVLIANSYAEPNVAYRFKQLVRVCKNGTWDAWVDNSPTAFAPSGTGYEKSPVVLKTSRVASEEDLNTVLEAVYSSMGSSETRLVRFYGYPSASDYGFFGFLFKSSANYGTLLVHSAFEKGTLWKKVKFGGTWQAIKPQATSMDLLWTNASPTSSFGAQQVSIADNDYDKFLVEFKNYSTGASYSHCYLSAIAIKGEFGMILSPGEEGGYICFRHFGCNATYINFQAAKYAKTYGGTLVESSNLLVPYRIYGIRGA